MQRVRPDQGDFVVPYAFMEPTKVQVREVDGARSYLDAEFALIRGFRPLLLDLHLPKGSHGPFPLVLYLHAGAWLTGSHKLTGAFRCMQPIVNGLLPAGYAVALPQYRLSSEALFPACLQDIVSAVRWLRRFAPDLGLDAKHFGVWGESAGGHLASLLAMNITDPEMLGRIGVPEGDATIQAAVSWYGTTDFLRNREQALPGSRPDFDAADAPGARLVGAPMLTVPDLARRASPLSWVTANAAPMHFVHGTADLTTPPLQSRSLCDSLTAAGVPSRVTWVEGADHELKGVDPSPYIEESIRFLDRTLRP